MRTLTTLTFLLTVCPGAGLTPLVAQTAFTAPPGFLAREGPGAASVPVPMANARARFQYVDGGQRGMSRAAIQSIAVRRDGAATGAFPARTMQLAVVLAHANVAAMTTTFANNYADVPVIVVATRGIALPDHTALPTTSPAPWSVVVPFDVPFRYDGVRDLLFEFRVSGNTSTAAYSLDTVDRTPAGGGTSAYLGRTSCATRNGQFDIYRRDPITDANGRVTLQTYAQGGPSSSAGVLAVGLSDPAIAGVLCAPLRTSAEVVLPIVTGAFGQVGGSAQPVELRFPFPGVTTSVFLQFAVLDPTQVGIPLALSDATVNTCVEHGAPLTVRAVYALGDPIAATGLESTTNVPVVRFVD